MWNPPVDEHHGHQDVAEGHPGLFQCRPEGSFYFLDQQDQNTGGNL